MNRRRAEKKDRERGRKRAKECKTQAHKGGGIEACGIVFRVTHGWDAHGCQEMTLLGA